MRFLSDAWRYTYKRTILTTVPRYLEAILGFVVAILYIVDVAKGKMDAKWLYAVVVSGISCLAAIYLVVIRRWDWSHHSVVYGRQLAWRAFSHLPFIGLWVGVAYIFGKLYIGNGADTKPTHMLIAAYLDLVNLGLWVFSGILSFSIWLPARHRRIEAGENHPQIKDLGFQGY